MNRIAIQHGDLLIVEVDSMPIGKKVDVKNGFVIERGEGKFHAVSRPYFGDDFRSEPGDKYIAIKIKVEDTHQWEMPEYPHKIGFREGLVLYECDRYGNKI